MVSRSTEADAAIGSYRIRRRIAVGGMSEVFAAESADGARVAVKILLPDLASTSEGREAFAHEAELGKRLEHDNIVRVIEQGDDPRGPYLVLEWVDGASLAACVESDRLSSEAALVVAADVLTALDQVHRASDERGNSLAAIHRDLSPDNIMVSVAGIAKLSDFGIARSRLRDRRTKTGVIRGKAHYLSPEQLTGSEVDARADLYALGCVLFELATGQRFVEGDGDLEVLRFAQAPVFRAPSSLGADAKLDALLERALARYPEERFQSAAAMKKQVQAILASIGDTATSRGRAELALRARASVQPFPSSEAPARSFPWKAAGVVSALSLAVAYGALSSGSASSPAGSPRASASPQPLVVDIASATSSAVTAAPPIEVSDSAKPAPEALPAASKPADAGPEATIKKPLAAATSSTALASAEPVSSSTASASGPAPAARLQARMKAVSEQLKRAKAAGHDVRTLEARSAVALQAYLDGRYDDTDRELSAIAAALPP